MATAVNMMDKYNFQVGSFIMDVERVNSTSLDKLDTPNKYYGELSLTEENLDKKLTKGGGKAITGPATARRDVIKAVEKALNDASDILNRKYGGIFPQSKEPDEDGLVEFLRVMTTAVSKSADCDGPVKAMEDIFHAIDTSGRFDWKKTHERIRECSVTVASAVSHLRSDVKLPMEENLYQTLVYSYERGR